MRQEVVLPFIPKAWNRFVGKHGFWPYRRFVENMHLWGLVDFRLLKPMEPPIRITFIYGFTSNRRSDIDALCTKPIVDALVRRGVVSDDNKKVVAEVVHRWEKTETQQTRIILETLS